MGWAGLTGHHRKVLIKKSVQLRAPVLHSVSRLGRRFGALTRYEPVMRPTMRQNEPAAVPNCIDPYQRGTIRCQRSAHCANVVTNWRVAFDASMGDLVRR